MPKDVFAVKNIRWEGRASMCKERKEGKNEAWERRHE